MGTSQTMLKNNKEGDQVLLKGMFLLALTIDPLYM